MDEGNAGFGDSSKEYMTEEHKPRIGGGSPPPILITDLPAHVLPKLAELGATSHREAKTETTSLAHNRKKRTTLYRPGTAWQASGKMFWHEKKEGLLDDDEVPDHEIAAALFDLATATANRVPVESDQLPSPRKRQRKPSRRTVSGKSLKSDFIYGDMDDLSWSEEEMSEEERPRYKKQPKRLPPSKQQAMMPSVYPNPQPGLSLPSYMHQAQRQPQQKQVPRFIPRPPVPPSNFKIVPSHVQITKFISWHKSMSARNPHSWAGASPNWYPNVPGGMPGRNLRPPPLAGPPPAIAALSALLPHLVGQQQQEQPGASRAPPGPRQKTGTAGATELLQALLAQQNRAHRPASQNTNNFDLKAGISRLLQMNQPQPPRPPPPQHSQPLSQLVQMLAQALQQRPNGAPAAALPQRPTGPLTSAQVEITKEVPPVLVKEAAGGTGSGTKGSPEEGGPSRSIMEKEARSQSMQEVAKTLPVPSNLQALAAILQKFKDNSGAPTLSDLQSALAALKPQDAVAK